MSSQNPRNPRVRRRIAGERRPTRPDELDAATEAADTTEPPGAPAGPERHGPAHTPVRQAEPGPVRAPVAPYGADTTEPAGGTTPSAQETAPREGAGPSWPVIAAIGAVALLLVVAAAVLGLGTWSYPEVREQDKVDAATRTAPATAERAAVAILSYDYKSLDADKKAAERYLTPSFEKKYAKSMKLVDQNAPRLHAKVEAEVKGSGVSHADPDRVNVLVYVNQTTVSTANGGQPQLALNRAMFSMVRQGDRWLVDDITSY